MPTIRQPDIPDRLQLTVGDGELTLEGSVEWMYQKAAAESAVKYLKGVRNLSNRMQISQTPTEIDVKARLEAAFRRSATMDAARIRIATDNRTVTLSGDVHSWSEREEAERVASTTMASFAPGYRLNDAGGRVGVRQ
jgi:osmotically-inducible protein OsmY